MTDLVERLLMAPHADFYKPSKWFELMTDAAVEISRLRTDYSILKGDYDALRELPRFTRTEVERLQRELTLALAEVDELRTDNERLRRQVKKF
jgi:hypothetical protein